MLAVGGEFSVLLTQMCVAARPQPFGSAPHFDATVFTCVFFTCSVDLLELFIPGRVSLCLWTALSQTPLLSCFLDWNPAERPREPGDFLW